MIVLIEPISDNIGMYVPAYPLPLMEIASFVRVSEPDTGLHIISIPVDYGLPLTRQGKAMVYDRLMEDIAAMKPSAVGVSCTAISQAGETIALCERIKRHDPGIFIFLGGYFPTLYPEAVFSRTRAVDAIVIGEGEVPTLAIARALKNGVHPKTDRTPNLAWPAGRVIHRSPTCGRFDLRRKALLDLALLNDPGDFGILPYAFSRGCPFRCNFCMEAHIRDRRQTVAREIVAADMGNLIAGCRSRSVLVADALFRSFDLFTLFRQLNVKVNFETRCDVLDAAIVPEIADSCGSLALGFESASYATLRRMNKVRDRSHYAHYLANTRAVFRAAAAHRIPVMVFMIVGYPGDTEDDLKQSLDFARELAADGGSGGHVFKVGECRVYPKTPLYDMAAGMDDVIFDDDGVFGGNVVRQPSRNLSFDTVLAYMERIFRLSRPQKATRQALLNMMPFFRLPPDALTDAAIPDTCFVDRGRNIFDAQGPSLDRFRQIAPSLQAKYGKSMAGERSSRQLRL